MTFYLVERSAPPITAEEIRNAIGLQTGALDLVIASGIASLCAMSSKPVVREVWDVTEGDDVARLGTPISVGPLRSVTNDSRQVRRVVYGAAPNIVAAIRQRAINWCSRQDDIALALMQQGGPVVVAEKAVA